MTDLALNPRQQQAVDHRGGPLMVIAGAGSGKTRTLTTRIATLIQEGVHPQSIMAITFTNKAANEMKDRIAQQIGDRIVGVVRDESGAVVRTRFNGMWVQTFHSVCARILRNHADAIGYTRYFSIYDTTDSRSAIKRAIKAAGNQPSKLKPAGIQRVISTLKNEMVDAQRAAQQAHTYDEAYIARIYDLYDRALYANNAMDFDDLLLQTVALFDANPDILAYYQQTFEHVLVDEWQDTNMVQFAFIKQLTAPAGNICVVGDGDQSIYGFRGADMRNITQFEHDFDDVTHVVLDQNYRSTQRILDAANAVISHNRGRQAKNLWSDKGEGESITLYQCASEDTEAAYVVQAIHKALDDGFSPHDIVILYRTNSQSRTLETTLQRAGIPFHIVGSVSFFARAEVKDLMAYLTLLINPADDASLLRVINTPKRGIGDKAVDVMGRIAEQYGCSLFDAARRMASDPDLTLRMRRGVAHFVRTMDEIMQMAAAFVPEDITPMEATLGLLGEQTTNTLGHLVSEVLRLSGLEAMYADDGDPDAQSRLDNLHEVANAAQSFADDYIDGMDSAQGLQAFLETNALTGQQDQIEEGVEKVTMMTIHTVKGLEYPVVLVTGFEEGLLPHANSMFSPDDVEEERRLAYVAITRAQQRLYLTYANMRRINGLTQVSQPSRFLEEIPPACTVFAYETASPAARRKLRASEGWDGDWSSDDDGSGGSTAGRSSGAYSSGGSTAGRSSGAYSSGGSAAGRSSGAAGLRDGAASSSLDEAGEVGELLTPGTRVVHSLFGIGVIKKVITTGVGEYIIAFKRFGTKRLACNTARLEVIG